MDNPGTRTLGIGRQPEGNEGVEDPGIGVPDAVRADDPGTRTPDVGGDRGVDDLGTGRQPDGDGGVDDPGREANNPGRGLEDPGKGANKSS